MILPQQDIQLPPSFSHQSPLEYLESLYNFLEKYRWLADLHVGDFITMNHWERLDPAWRQALLPEAFEDEEAYQTWFASILNLTNATKVDDDWPDSLKDYFRSVKDLPLPRLCTQTIDDQGKVDKHKLAGGMSDKKIHEVELLAKLIKTIGDDHGISQVLDLGSGQGYLSRILAYKHGMRVLAVDMSEIQTKGAERFDQRALKALSLSAQEGNLKHVTEMVTPENVGDVLSKWGDSDDDDGKDKDDRWIVCGLHTCGDLATSIFRLFANSDQIKWMVNVGCCYHFLSEEGTQPGFPMGDWLKGKSYQLGNSARVLACQSPSKWTDPVIGQQSFNQYFYRAVLLHTIVDKGLAEKAPAIGMVKRKKTYLQYYQTAMKRLDYGPDVISEIEAERYYQMHKEQHVDKQIIVLWTLRVLLAPVLESLILMDRWLYLKSLSENDPSDVKMWPLFDPIASPRNMCIIVSKK